MKCTVCKMDIHFEICKAQISGCVSRMTVNRKGSPLENIQIYTRLCLQNHDDITIHTRQILSVNACVFRAALIHKLLPTFSTIPLLCVFSEIMEVSYSFVFQHAPSASPQVCACLRGFLQQTQTHIEDS